MILYRSGLANRGITIQGIFFKISQQSYKYSFEEHDSQSRFGIYCILYGFPIAQN